MQAAGGTRNIAVHALLFLCATYTFKLLLDARLRYRLSKAGRPETVGDLLGGARWAACALAGR